MRSKIVKFNKYQHKKSSWITQGLLKSIRYRDQLYKKFKLSNPNSPNYDTIKTNLKTYNLILKQNKSSAKQIYYETWFHQLRNDIRNTWKTINEILTKNKKPTSYLQFLKKMVQTSLSSSFPFVRGEVLPATFSPPHLIVFSTLLCLLSSSSSLPPRLPSSHLS